MQQITKFELLQLLRSSPEPVTLQFTKRDGSNREMVATLHPEHIPAVNGSPDKEGPEHLLVVYDVEKESWRAVNFTNPVYLVS